MTSGHDAAEPWRVLSRLATLVAVVGLFWGPIEGAVSDWRPPSQATPGFHARIGSAPSGAEIWIQGRARGTTPWIGNVDCRHDEQVVIEVKAAGFETWQRSPLCREGQSLEITARLKRLEPTDS